MPLVNWLLGAVTIGAVFGFGSSEALACAYGIAVSLLMVITTVLSALVALQWGFNPIAESINGARGLMQVIPKYHAAKLAEYGGEKALFDPVANVKIGSRILKDYIRLTGNLGIALQMYGGALSDGEDQYTAKVMTEQQRLKQALSPASRASSSSTSAASPRPASLTSQ